MVPRENENNAYAKFWRTSKQYYGIFESGPYKPHFDRQQFKTTAKIFGAINISVH